MFDSGLSVPAGVAVQFCVPVSTSAKVPSGHVEHAEGLAIGVDALLLYIPGGQAAQALSGYCWSSRNKDIKLPTPNTAVDK